MRRLRWRLATTSATACPAFAAHNTDGSGDSDMRFQLSTTLEPHSEMPTNKPLTCAQIPYLTNRSSTLSTTFLESIKKCKAPPILTFPIHRQTLIKEIGSIASICLRINIYQYTTGKTR